MKAAAQATNAVTVRPKIGSVVVTRKDTGAVVTIAPRTKVGMVACPGEAHTNGFQDHCMVCLGGPWGLVPSYAPVTPAACMPGVAVPVNYACRNLRNEAFDAAEKAGTIQVVSIEHQRVRRPRKGETGPQLESFLYECAYVAVER